MTWLEFADRYFRVRKCGGCGKILSFEDCYEAFCPECRRKWNQAKTESCGNCFQSVAECTCQPKLLEDASVPVLRKLIFYVSKRDHEPQNRIIYSIKKRHNRRLFSFLASELKPAIEQQLATLEIGNPQEEAVLAYVPRGKRSKAAYGFDQSGLLCRYLSKMTEIPCAFALERTRSGKEQKHLSKKDRVKNMKQSISVRDGAQIRGKCIFLLDDVVTTGASMSVCAAALKKAGARCIIAISLAYTSR